MEQVIDSDERKQLLTESTMDTSFGVARIFEAIYDVCKIRQKKCGDKTIAETWNAQGNWASLGSKQCTLYFLPQPAILL